MLTGHVWTGHEIGHVMRKPAFCICGNHAADQRPCFCFIDKTSAHFVSDVVGKSENRFSHDITSYKV